MGARDEIQPMREVLLRTVLVAFLIADAGCSSAAAKPSLSTSNHETVMGLHGEAVPVQLRTFDVRTPAAEVLRVVLIRNPANGIFWWTIGDNPFHPTNLLPFRFVATPRELVRFQTASSPSRLFIDASRQQSRSLDTAEAQVRRMLGTRSVPGQSTPGWREVAIDLSSYLEPTFGLRELDARAAVIFVADVTQKQASWIVRLTGLNGDGAEVVLNEGFGLVKVTRRQH